MIFRYIFHSIFLYPKVATCIDGDNKASDSSFYNVLLYVMLERFKKYVFSENLIWLISYWRDFNFK